MSSAAMLTTSGKLPTNQALALPSAGYSLPFLQSQEATLGPKGLDRCTQVWIGEWELKVSDIALDLKWGSCVVVVASLSIHSST